VVLRLEIAPMSDFPVPDLPDERGPQRPYSMGRVRELDSLLGTHPAALADLYQAGHPLESGCLGGDHRGRVLALALDSTFMLVRPLMVALARGPALWRGKSFVPDGRAGHNLLGRWRAIPFRAETCPSELDGAPTLMLRYDGLGNPWPLSRVVDELRQIDDTVAIGPVSLRTARGSVRLGWWGLELPASAP
jgi:hypothetical protein